MRKYLIFVCALILVACASQESLVQDETQEEVTTVMPSEPPVATESIQPTNTIALPTPTATRRPASTPAYETGAIMINPADGASMVYIPPGEFMMGNDSGEVDEQPAHLVNTEGFWMYQYEVTNEMYAKCRAEKKCNAPDVDVYPDDLQIDNYPVVYVNWFGGRNYCEWVGGRLPTEAEWEKAARGGLEGMPYPWGNDYPECVSGSENGASFDDCTQEYGYYPWPVGSFAPNGYGLYDMAGNVREWVSDGYQEDFYTLLLFDNPSQSSGAYKVVRGGGYNSLSENITVSDRYWTLMGEAFHATGIRCVVSP